MNNLIDLALTNSYWLISLGAAGLLLLVLWRLRVPNFGKLATIVALVVLAGGAAKDPAKYNPGVDLSGGTILIYQARHDDPDAPKEVQITKLVDALKQRLDPEGIYSYSIRAMGTDRVEIIMPRAHLEDVDRVKRKISTVGQLQFLIVANQQDPKHKDLMDRAEITWPNRRVGETGIFMRFGVWLPLDSGKRKDGAVIEMAKDLWPNRDKVERVGEGGESVYYGYVAQTELPTNIKPNPSRNVVKQAEDGRVYVLCRWDDDGVGVRDRAHGGIHVVKTDSKTGERYVLMVKEEGQEYEVTGDYLTRVYPTSHEGSLAVAFNFDSVGAARFSKLTGKYRPLPGQPTYQLGVVLDSRLRSAPNLQAQISDRGVITLGSNATREEVDELVSILDAGQLPATLDKDPSSEFQIGATLGKDTIEKGKIAMAGSLVLVSGFMIFYYRFAGMVAIFGLVLNLLFTVALMVLFHATWTLPGLAGLVLTVGMAVDSNVLIYERIREELERGASLGMAIRNGYSKAWTTIFDSNVTTLLTAIILFYIGTDQVRGFAVTLSMGILTSMFCALFVTRQIFDLAYSKRWLNRLTMLKVMSHPNFDFLRTQRFWIATSGVVIAVGMGAMVLRGANNFDIDLLGGTMVGVQFDPQKPPVEAAEVRTRAAEQLENVSIETVQFQGETPGYRYLVRTTDRDEPGTSTGPSVRERVVEAFREHLKLPKVEVDFAGIRPVADNPDPPDFAPFVGGKQTVFRFDQPRSAESVRMQLNAFFERLAPGGNPEDLYALATVGAGVEAPDRPASEKVYTEFRIASTADLAAVLKDFQKQATSTPVFDQFNQFGPQVAGETQQRAIWAIILSWVVIIGYVGFRFGSWTFGIAGVLALVHDSLVCVGLAAMVSLAAPYIPGLNEMKMNLTMVAAVLTLIGYSINDTIVIFDRIREIRGKSPKLTDSIVNRSLNETLSRTIITALTVFMSVLVLYIWAGVELEGFSFVMVAGSIVGTYSTLYIACPLVLMMLNYADRRKAQKERRLSGPSASAAAL